MDEKLIILEDEDVVEIEIQAEDIEETVEAEETIDVVEVETVEEIEIEVDEAVGWVGGDSTRHYSLNGRDEADQHPIGAITGLRSELDKIEALQTVYSDKKQQADYYMWHDEIPTNPYGLFVAIYPDTDKIQICDGTIDVFGVTVAEAAFVGNQEYVQAVDGAKTGRDGKYCLVVNSGLVGVRCETDVTVGDYVVPNSRGEAKTSNGDYGYLVTALSEVNGIQHAMISLAAPSTLSKRLADSVKDVSGRMATAEYNITSVTNVANSAYAIAKDAKENAEVDIEDLEEKITEVLGRMDKIDGEDGIVDNLNQSINNACSDAALAKTIANNAVSSAQQIGDDAYASANEAIAAIKDIGAGSTSWAKRLDAYSVGEYSQAYGLTWEQAKEALPIGIVHVPTITHTEIYDTYTQEFSIGYYYEWNGEKWSPSYSSAVNFSSVYIEGSERTPYWVVTDADVEYNGVVYKLGYLYKWEAVAWSMTGASVAENTLTRAVSAMHQTANELSMEVTNARGDAASLAIRLEKDEAVVQNLARWTGSEEGKWNIATTKASADADGASIALVVVKDVEGEDVEDIELAGARIVLNDGEKGSYIQMDADRINFTADDYSVIADNIKLDGYVTFTNLETEGATKIHGGNITTGTIDAKQINVNGDLSAFGATIGGWNITKNEISKSNVRLKSDDGHLLQSLVDTTTKSPIRIGVYDNDNMINHRTYEYSGAITGETFSITYKTGLSNVYNASAVVTHLSDAQSELSVVDTHINSGDITVNLQVGNLDSQYLGSDYVLEISVDILLTPFCVLEDGSVYAQAAQIQGHITATSGKIGECTINEDGSISSVDDLFRVDSNGVLTAKAGVLESRAYDGIYIWDNDSVVSDKIVDNTVQKTASTGLEMQEYNTHYRVIGIGTCTDRDIVIPSTYNNKPVLYIDDNAFESEVDITSITIPNTIKKISKGAFSDCTNLKKVIIQGDILSIEDSAFYNCADLQQINLPLGLTKIGQGAFGYCSSLTGITIPCTVTSIGIWAFEKCSSLTGELFIPDSVTYLGDESFLECTQINKVIIGSGVNIINSKVFAGCTQLESAIMSDFTTEIDQAAFSGCTKLKYIIIGANVGTIKLNAFYNCNALETVYYSGETEADWNSMTISNGNTNLTSATRYYYSATKPTTNGNYWYKTDGGLRVSFDDATINSKHFTVNSDGKVFMTSPILQGGTAVFGDWSIGDVEIYDKSQGQWFISSALYTQPKNGGSQTCLTADGVYVITRDSSGNISNDQTYSKTWLDICK